jgi:hypothetical protein
MSCAGCPEDECPRDTWHLHLTVVPHWSWNLRDVSSALKREIERYQVRPVVVTNVFHDDPSRNYKELIPTKHFRGTEAEASREIFQLGLLLNNAGWRVRRMKIEGDPSRLPVGRALYHEVHLKNPSLGIVMPTSINAAGDRIITIRRPTADDIHNFISDMVDRMLLYGHPLPPRIEATVLDTNPELDHDWINQ